MCVYQLRDQSLYRYTNIEGTELSTSLFASIIQGADYHIQCLIQLTSLRLPLLDIICLFHESRTHLFNVISHWDLWWERATEATILYRHPPPWNSLLPGPRMACSLINFQKTIETFLFRKCSKSRYIVYCLSQLCHQLVYFCIFCLLFYCVIVLRLSIISLNVSLHISTQFRINYNWNSR